VRAIQGIAVSIRPSFPFGRISVYPPLFLGYALLLLLLLLLVLNAALIHHTAIGFRGGALASSSAIPAISAGSPAGQGLNGNNGGAGVKARRQLHLPVCCRSDGRTPLVLSVMSVGCNAGSFAGWQLLQSQ